MDNKFHRKLARMGVFKGLKGFKTEPSPAQKSKLEPPPAFVPAQEMPLPGREIATEHGPVWVDKRTYPARYIHGAYPLGDMAGVSAEALTLLGEGTLGTRPAFVDTETTGLTGGAGTLAFLTGIGVWANNELTLHLIFLREPAEEVAVLRYIAAVLSEATGLVTFNGCSFDLPLLETRFIMNRLPPLCLSLPHLDLLTVARQLWRDYLPSRRLGEIETKILEIHRTGEDVPSWLIPELYRQYLNTGVTGEMTRIFYHNEIDILSLLTLLIHAARMAMVPDALALASGEWVGVGRLYDRAAREDDALSAWRRALTGDHGPLDSACAARQWREVSTRYKRRKAWDDALVVWDRWATRRPLDAVPFVERAKYEEWTVKDLDAALVATQTALTRAQKYPYGADRTIVLAELEHRKARLERKIGKMQEARGKMQEAGCKMQEAGCKMQEAGCKMQEAGCKMQEAGCKMQEADGK